MSQAMMEVAAPRSYAVIGAPERRGAELGPLTHDATLVLEGTGGEPRTTCLAAGRPTLLAAGSGGTHRHAMRAFAGRLDAARGVLVLDLLARFQWNGPSGVRLVLALDDDRTVSEGDESTLPTPGSAAAPALPYQASSVRPPPPIAPRLPAPPPRVDDAGGWRPTGAADASNRASAPGPRTVTRDGAAPTASPRSPEALDLLWCESSASPSLRGRPAWKRLLRAAEGRDGGHEQAEDPTAEVEARRAAMAIFLDAHVDPVASWPSTFASAAAVKGRLAAPLVTAAAFLVLDFDPRAALLAWCAAARPHVAGDAEAKAAMEHATALAASDDGMTPTEELEEARMAVRQAFSARERRVSVEVVEARARQTLVERRAHKEVQLRGQPHLRGLLHDEHHTGEAGVVTYLAGPCAAQLPLARVVPVRVVVALVPPHEPALDRPFAARVVALARSFAPTPKAL